jgi:hypothetical protein
MSHQVEFGQFGAVTRGPYTVTVTGIGHSGKLSGEIEGLGSAVVQWSGDDIFANSEIEHFTGTEVFSGDEYFGNIADYDEGFGEDEIDYGSLFKFRLPAGQSKGKVVTEKHLWRHGKFSFQNLAKGVAKVAATGAAGAAIVFPPAGGTLAVVAGAAGAAATIASQLDSKDSARKAKGEAVIAATMKLAKDSAIGQAAAAAAASRAATATARQQAARQAAIMKAKREGAERALEGIQKVRNVRNLATKRGKKLAFVLTKRGYVIRVK